METSCPDNDISGREEESDLTSTSLRFQCAVTSTLDFSARNNNTYIHENRTISLHGRNRAIEGGDVEVELCQLSVKTNLFQIQVSPQAWVSHA